MSDEGRRTVVTVRIAGEEYAIRTEASPDYTRECAAYVDETLREILEGGVLQSHKAPVLVALAITDRLFEMRAQMAALREELALQADRMAAGIDAEIEATSLATPP